MPTPFYHLVLADEVLAHPALDAGLRARLQAARGAFLFGHTAPDVQTVSGQTREATHFFRMPLVPGHRAVNALLATHPALGHPAALAEAHAAFVAGYLAHLRLDELWIEEIFTPYFGLAAPWGADFRERLLIHNVLRTHLDLQDVPRLRGWAGGQMRAARPSHWLPFTADEYLATWRDLLADQLELNGASDVRTVEIFAARMRVAPAAIRDLLSPEQLAERVWRHMPASRLEEFREHGLAETVELIEHYYAR